MGFPILSIQFFIRRSPADDYVVFNVFGVRVCGRNKTTPDTDSIRYDFLSTKYNVIVVWPGFCVRLAKMAGMPVGIDDTPDIGPYSIGMSPRRELLASLIIPFNHIPLIYESHCALKANQNDEAISIKNYIRIVSITANLSFTYTSNTHTTVRHTFSRHVFPAS